MKFVGYLCYSAVLTALVYPMSGMWVWGGGWLAKMEFHDFAGSVLVHAVGGLRDTVVDATTGFTFDGTGLAAQTGALLERLRAALELKAHQPQRWGAIRRRARAARFAWTDSIEAYLERLYRLG